MADISKINPNGTEYNLKDTTARTNIGNLSNLDTTEKTDLVSAVNEVNSELADFSNGIVPLNDSVEVTLLHSAALETYMLYTYGDSSQFSTVTYLTYNFNGVYEATTIASNTGITITAALPNNKIRITNNTPYNCLYKIKKL